jgi:hypothetical protein
LNDPRVVDLFKERLFAAEVTEQQSFVDPSLGGDASRPRARDSMPGEFDACGVEQAFLGVVGSSHMRIVRCK